MLGSYTRGDVLNILQYKFFHILVYSFQMGSFEIGVL